MGLNFSHGDSRFGYVQFNRIRRMLEGYTHHLNDILETEGETCKNKDNIKKTIDALSILIEHSDSDGEISVSDLEKLLDAICEFLGETHYDNTQVRLFLGSISKAIESNKPL